MTNRLLHFGIGMAVLTVLFSLSSCKNETPSPYSKIVGTWKGTQQITVPENEVTYLFRDDKTYTYTTNAGPDESGTYTTDGSSVIMSHSISSVNIEATVSGETGNSLTLQVGSDSGTFGRKSGSSSLVGTWEETLSHGSDRLIFQDGGTVIYEKKLNDANSNVLVDFVGTYTFSSGTLAMSFASSSTSNTYSIDGSAMSMAYRYDDEVKMSTLAKQ